MLAQWLISAGHTPKQADQWLTRRPAWRSVDPKVLDYFATKNAERWASKSAAATAAWMHDLAAWMSQWSGVSAPHQRGHPDQLTLTVDPDS